LVPLDAAIMDSAHRYLASIDWTWRETVIEISDRVVKG
jgi:hypothetical protein